MCEYKKTVDDLSKLKGWRECSGEELKVAQGLLLANLKSRYKTGRVFIWGTTFVSLLLLLDIIPTLFESIYKNDIRHFFSNLVFMSPFFYVVYAGGREIFGEIFDNYYKRLRNVIINGDIKVNDIEVVQLDSNPGYDGSIQDYWAKIQDIEGNLYKKTVYVLSAEKNIEKGRALLIYAESKGDTKEMIIPYKEKSPKTWEAGLHLYKKNMK